MLTLSLQTIIFVSTLKFSASKHLFHINKIVFPCGENGPVQECWDILWPMPFPLNSCADDVVSITICIMDWRVKYFLDETENYSEILWQPLTNWLNNHSKIFWPFFILPRSFHHQLNVDLKNGWHQLWARSNGEAI